MATKEKLDDEQIKEFLKELPKWKLVDGKLQRECKFDNFVEAFAFMTAVAIVAEKMNHHPEWFNVWATVKIDLATHEANGITELDIALAKKIDKLSN
ncbi:MAG: 4a-hydroxytetrahydrobiopterin dehydratase [Verrucomicrobiota bacterium]